ncbi:MAG: hypothetical protein GY854_32240 [Deltaproteobacteria bacterium]|nr:hypothetical protein [Deltaproteobacteria bacterium]
MSSSNKDNPKFPDAADLPELEDSLPPLDHDEVEETDPGDLTVYIEDLDAEETPVADDQVPAIDKLAIAQSLIEPVESSWLEEVEEDNTIDMDFAEIDEDQGWTGSENDAADTLDDVWFVTDEEDESPLDDGGAEGLLDEEETNLAPDRAQWDDLGSETDDEGEEDEILDVMEHLGIELPAETLDSVVDICPRGLLDQQYLGPRGGDVLAAGFVGGSPVGVGDGFFVLGADGMLHPTIGSQMLAEARATSMCVHKETVFLGTRSGGALVTRNRGLDFSQINHWYTHGLDRDKLPSLGHLSTSFEIVGQALPKGYRLLGLNGEGQIFASVDRGQSWRGPLIRSRCLALSTIVGTSDFIAVIDSTNRGVSLLRYRTPGKWEKRALPKTIATQLSQNPFSLAAGSDTVIIAVDDPMTPLFRSIDGGRTWSAVEGMDGVTAIAVDPGEPEWMVAATYSSSRGAGIIRISEDGGQRWRIALTIDKTDEQEKSVTDQTGHEESKVRRLVVDDRGRTRQVLAITGLGVHLITLVRPAMSH